MGTRGRAPQPGALLLVLGPASVPQPAQAIVHQQLGLLEAASAGRVIAPQDPVEPGHGAVPRHLAHQGRADEGDLGFGEVGAEDGDAAPDHIHRRPDVVPEDLVEAGPG